MRKQMLYYIWDIYVAIVELNQLKESLWQVIDIRVIYNLIDVRLCRQWYEKFANSAGIAYHGQCEILFNHLQDQIMLEYNNEHVR